VILNDNRGTKLGRSDATIRAPLQRGVAPRRNKIAGYDVRAQV
jgi:hypothetical protein